MKTTSLFKEGAIWKSHRDYREFIYTTFVKRKSDGEFRPLLVLIKLDKLAGYKTFKMEIISTMFCFWQS